MHFRTLAICLLTITSSGAIIFSQTSKTQSADIYTHFVGVWVGSDSYLKNGVAITVPLRIEITETKKKNAIRCDYVYGKKGEKNFEHNIRLITLDPLKVEMTSKWKGKTKEHYKATGLESFALTGLGTFTATTTVLEDGKVSTYGGTFRLGKDTFFYQWDKSFNGQPFIVNGVFTLARETHLPPIVVPPSLNPSE